MLRSEHKHTEFEDILQELLASSTRPTARLLAEFVQKYPGFANEILSFASEWALQELMDESEIGHEIDEKLSQSKARTAFQNALHRFDHKIKSEAVREFDAVVDKAEDSKAPDISTKSQDDKIEPP